VTSLDNGIPLCGHHHRRAHDDRFTLTILPSGEARFRRHRGTGPLLDPVSRASAVEAR
jgi:hypothetical protein